MRGFAAAAARRLACFVRPLKPLNAPLIQRDTTDTVPAMDAILGTIIIYARDVHKSAVFYSEQFGFKTTGEVVEGLIELEAPAGGASILIHQAAKGVKLGQVGVKLSFHVRDVESFAAASAERGLEFGAAHQANGYVFANAKDPDNNSISISSRAYRTSGKREA